MKQIAIIGPTASGKSDVALQLAHQHHAYILSIDSLSIYKEIDIASAKPSVQTRQDVKHFGIDELYPHEHFDVSNFIDYYQQACLHAKEHNKNLIIVGGTGFYLKSLFTGISPLPLMDADLKLHVATLLQDLPAVYHELLEVDAESMQRISPLDRYRIEKMLLIYKASGMAPSQWFKEHPAQPVITDLPLFEIEVKRDTLRERIAKRTQLMIATGLIDEVAYLEQKYGRMSHAMGAIGIVEVLEFLDGYCNKETMTENIITHTSQLAKRQQTFNRSQFPRKHLLPRESLVAEAAIYM